MDELINCDLYVVTFAGGRQSHYIIANSFEEARTTAIQAAGGNNNVLRVELAGQAIQKKLGGRG